MEKLRDGRLVMPLMIMATKRSREFDARILLNEANEKGSCEELAIFLGELVIRRRFKEGTWCIMAAKTKKEE